MGALRRNIGQVYGHQAAEIFSAAFLYKENRFFWGGFLIDTLSITGV